MVIGLRMKDIIFSKGKIRKEKKPVKNADQEKCDIKRR